MPHTLIAYLFYVFICVFGIACDTDQRLAAKLNQEIMAYVNIVSHVAKYLYLHILPSEPSKP